MNIEEKRSKINKKLARYLKKDPKVSCYIKLAKSGSDYKEQLKLFRKAFKSKDKDIKDALWNSTFTYDLEEKDFRKDELAFIKEKKASEKFTAENCFNFDYLYSNINSEFETERLILKPSKVEQDKETKEHLKHFKKDGDFEMYTATKYSERYAKHIMIHFQNSFMLYRKDTNELIGHIGIKAVNPTTKVGEVTYYLFKEHRHQGYANEAIKKIIELAFTTKLKCLKETIREDKYIKAKNKIELITAKTRADNYPSQRLLENNGFIKTGVIHRINSFKKNEYIDEYYYELFKNID